MGRSQDELASYFMKASNILVILGTDSALPDCQPGHLDDPVKAFGGLQEGAVDDTNRSDFARNPSLVWRIYEHQRDVAKADDGHRALAELAKIKPKLLTITETVNEPVLNRRAWQSSLALSSSRSAQNPVVSTGITRGLHTYHVTGSLNKPYMKHVGIDFFGLTFAAYRFVHAARRPIQVYCVPAYADQAKKSQRTPTG
nr:hypothetical protein B0A51_00061 [Rachicladosporium sp. CCFEE 5018]